MRARRPGLAGFLRFHRMVRSIQKSEFSMEYYQIAPGPIGVDLQAAGFKGG